MKIILLMIILIIPSNAALVVNSLISSYIVSTVTLDNGIYNYQYSTSTANVITLTVNPNNVFNYYSNQNYTLNLTPKSVRFSQNTNKSIFGFYSYSGPKLSYATLTIENGLNIESIYVPIPEIGNFILSSFGFVLIFKRKR